MLDDAERKRLLQTWRECEWEFLDGATWAPVLPLMPVALVTAWNPGAQRLPDAVNQGRDRVLRAELVARSLEPQRARGRSTDGSWREDGWMIAHDDAVVLPLLARYGQLAAVTIDGDDRAIVWADGRVDQL